MTLTIAIQKIRRAKMVSKIQEFLELNSSVLRQKGIAAIYLFGSRANGLYGPLSDYDYAILTTGGHFKRGDELHSELYDLLSKCSPRTLDNDVIDIVFLRDAPLELRNHVVRFGKVIFDPQSSMRLEFESMTTLLYCDFRPLLDEMDAAILEAI